MIDKTVSVAIVTRNRAKLLHTCLSSLSKQAVFPEEVLVIDKGSTDQTKKVALSFDKILPVRYIVELQVGIPYARNRALKEAKGKILAFIDDDCEATPTWIEEIVKAHKKYPKVAAILGKSIAEPKNSPFSIIWQHLNTVWIKKNTTNSKQLLTFETQNVSFKKSIIDDLDIQFDHSFPRGEDQDFAKQILANNQIILFEAKIIIHHWARDNFFSFLKEKYVNGAMQGRLERKWPESFFPKPSLENTSLYKLALKNMTDNLFFIRRAILQFVLIFSEAMWRMGYASENKKLFVKKTGLKNTYLAKANITIVVITRNRDSQLKRIFISLLMQTSFPREILVVDNASTDKTKAVALSFRNMLPIRYIYEPKIGIPYARNRALKEAKGEILAFIDDDCEATPTWVEEIVKAHKKYPKVAAIQGATISKPTKTITTFWQTVYNLWLKANTDKNGYLLVLDTKNISFKLPILHRLHLRFDEQFQRGSDVDMAKQLLHKNQVIMYYPQASVYHWERNNIIAFLWQRYQVGKTQAMLEFKWPLGFPKPSLQYDKLYLATIRAMELKQLYIARFFLRAFRRIYKYIFRLGFVSMKNANILKTIKPVRKYETNIFVAIITRNRYKLLEKCLFALSRQSVSPKEIIVVDNASHDLTKAITLSFKNVLPIKYVYEPVIGESSARNRALTEAREKILAFIDDDCEATPTWVEEMVKAHKKYPKVAAIQGGSKAFNQNNIFNKLEEESHHSWIYVHLSGESELHMLDTKNVSLKTDLLRDNVIQFDTTLHRAVDYDLAKQLLSKKQRIVYYPQAQILFRSRRNLFAYLKQRFIIGFHKARLAQKWPDMNSIRRRKPSMLFFINMQGYKAFLIVIIKFLAKHTYMAGYTISRLSYYYRFERLQFTSKHEVNYSTNRIFRLSVMIITKDRTTLLKRCLQSIIRQTRIPNEVIIVDSSKEKVYSSIEKIKKYLPIKYIYEQTLGFGVARNTALKNATGDIIATIDDDEEASPDWCENIIKAHLQTPKILAIQGRIISNPSTSPWAFVEQIRMDRWFLNNLDRTGQIRTMSTKNVSFKLKRFRKLKLNFSTLDGFNRFGSEDIDMARQILLANETIIYSPSVSVYHWERPTLISYLKQQYRKGCSNSLLIEWLKQEKQPSRLPLPKVMQPFLELIQHPLTRGNILRIIQLLPIYYLSLIFFQMGLSQKLLKTQTSMVTKQKKARSFVVAIITRNRAQSLRRALYSLESQTVLPTEVIIVDNGSSDDTKAVAISFTTKLKIKYYYEKKAGIPFARNRALKEAEGEIIAFLDDDCEATPTWVEKMLEAHKKYGSVAIIQGRSISAPKDSIFSVIAQFNRQTWVRDAMLGDRDLYWEWIKGTLNKDFEILMCDTRNSSMKLDHIQRLHITFDEKLERGLDTEFGNQLFSEGERSIYYPKAFVLHWERENLREFLKQSWFQGRTSARIAARWPSEYRIQRKRVFLKKLFSFTYFCIKNKYVMKFPLLIGLFLLYRHAYRKGSLYEKQYTVSNFTFRN